MKVITISVWWLHVSGTTTIVPCARCIEYYDMACVIHITANSNSYNMCRLTIDQYNIHNDLHISSCSQLASYCYFATSPIGNDFIASYRCQT